MAESRFELLTGWSRTAPTAATVVSPGSESELDALLAGAGPRGLLARGVPGYHVYILNRAESALELIAALRA